MANTIRVEFNGSVIAESNNPLLLRETRHVPVFYSPREDVRKECLTASGLITLCPFKGEATYWSVTVDDKCLENLTKALPTPVLVGAKFRDCYAGTLASLSHHRLKDVSDAQEIFTLSELLDETA